MAIITVFVSRNRWDKVSKMVAFGALASEKGLRRDEKMGSCLGVAAKSGVLRFSGMRVHVDLLFTHRQKKRDWVLHSRGVVQMQKRRRTGEGTTKIHQTWMAQLGMQA